MSFSWFSFLYFLLFIVISWFKSILWHLWHSVQLCCSSFKKHLNSKLWNEAKFISITTRTASCTHQCRRSENISTVINHWVFHLEYGATKSQYFRLQEEKNMRILLTPYTSVFTSLYGYLSVCMCIAKPGSINTKSCSHLNYGWGIYTVLPLRHHLFFLLWRDKTEPKREAEAEETENELGIDRKRDREVVTPTEPKRAWWRTNCDWQQAARTGLTMEERNTDCALCLCSSALHSSTDINWYDFNPSSRVL